MTPEEKAVFQCLEDEEFVDDGDAEYEELEDDFLLLANEGKPALVEAPSSSDAEEKDGESAEREEFENKGVVFVRDEEAEQLKAMREELKRRFGGIIGGRATNEEDGEAEEEEYEEVEEINEDQEAGGD